MNKLTEVFFMFACLIQIIYFNKQINIITMLNMDSDKFLIIFHQYDFLSFLLFLYLNIIYGINYIKIILNLPNLK